jgi:hypothetical protein
MAVAASCRPYRAFDVGDDEVGLLRTAVLDELPAVFRGTHHAMSQQSQRFLEIVAHFVFVVGDDNP